MSNFKPQIRVITKESLWEYENQSIKRKSAFKTVYYNTYRELKKNIKKHLEENLEPMVSVYRTRRGEWGEWFEHWMLEGGKPKIVKQGWM